MRKPAAPSRGSEAEREVAQVFRRAGWKVDRRPNEGADLLIRRGDAAYLVEVKVASEGRSDRLLPLLSQAILEAQSRSKKFGEPVRALAVIAAPRIAPRAIEHIREFAHLHAPDVAIGLIDFEGLREFSGPGLESLNAYVVPSHVPPREKSVDLFSDLNQWLIKVLLAQYLPKPDLLNAPSRGYRNASELAVAARVSLMTASRFIHQLSRQGFLHESSQEIRLVRVEELMQRWQMAAAIRPVLEIGARWILPREGRVRLQRAVSADASRACLGLFAAANELHLGFVHGSAVHIYVRDVHERTLSAMELIPAQQGEPSEVFLRLASPRESVFRGAVVANGIRVSDAIQVWLDVANDPVRGKEQAEIVFKRVVKPMIQAAQHAR